MITLPRNIQNGQAIDLRDVPLAAVADFRRTVIETTRAGGRIVALFGCRAAAPGGLSVASEGAGATSACTAAAPGFEVRLFAVLAHEGAQELEVLSTDVGASYPALTPECMQAHLFEREIFEQCGVRPEGHPWLKPVRFPNCSARERLRAPLGVPPAECGVTDFFRVEGEEVHEVAVGPVHAGIIEPGHFRFQCHGENVQHLEISLGYQHRGVERALRDGPAARTLPYLETLSGDTTIGHALAGCGAIEALAGAEPSPRAHALRGIALELERLANHTGDMGALANDVGFLPTASFCGRLRGDWLNMTALLCGSRFGRGMVRPGGTGFDADAARLADLRRRLEATFKDTAGAVEMLWVTPSVLARFEETGPVRGKTCRALGLVGVAARACGMNRDVRAEFPFGVYRTSPMPAAVWRGGDVCARAWVRWLEIQRSVEFIRGQLDRLPEGDVRRPVGALRPNALVVSLTEGWRGEIAHVAITDERGRFGHYKVVDPSFHNWMGLALALRGQQISDFPLCNKSFNLSYCGHDL